jgi:hypothetical protein
MQQVPIGVAYPVQQFASVPSSYIPAATHPHAFPLSALPGQQLAMSPPASPPLPRQQVPIVPIVALPLQQLDAEP